jgi:hypothetical protein
MYGRYIVMLVVGLGTSARLSCFMLYDMCRTKEKSLGRARRGVAAVRTSCRTEQPVFTKLSRGTIWGEVLRADHDERN